MKISGLIAYLDAYLKLSEIEDYGPQGLQVEADGEQIQRIALAVDTAPAVISAAAEWAADMLLVHHGILWRSVEPISGPLGRRVRLLLEHDIHLYAAHLALDAHPDVGNNAVLARLLDVEREGQWCEVNGTPIGVHGSAQPVPLEQFVERVARQLDSRPRVLAFGPSQVRRVAIVSGFGADRIAEAGAVGVDTYLTGESSHAHYWAAEDHRLNVIFAGHYATETVGVRSLGKHLTDRYGLEVKFFDFPTAM